MRMATTSEVVRTRPPLPAADAPVAAKSEHADPDRAIADVRHCMPPSRSEIAASGATPRRRPAQTDERQIGSCNKRTWLRSQHDLTNDIRSREPTGPARRRRPPCPTKNARSLCNKLLSASTKTFHCRERIAAKDAAHPSRRSRRNFKDAPNPGPASSIEESAHHDIQTQVSHSRSGMPRPWRRRLRQCRAGRRRPRQSRTPCRRTTCRGTIWLR